MSRLDVVVDRLASGAAVVRLAGELEHEYAYTLDVQLQKLESEADTLVIHLRGLLFMDSAGLGRLLAARRRAARLRPPAGDRRRQPHRRPRDDARRPAGRVRDGERDPGDLEPPSPSGPPLTLPG